ncbi:MAG TPA: M23 family metallopeptidase [Chitinophagales bacterium]|nr:M23 family metallopeptidase [Chitinophagales bacterium]HMX03250.1 M23 family metallopeptidase [Chitinophagales bacterium]HMZ89092.1 M23 family metallopeptidase [Chitinophagales bacterium]HNA56612.1 M23 family metallopeptidase [Chitinophagales bacterium]HNE45392.1 M23 family metallopeptidase [Chitinophagales bacterium]
MHDKTFEVQASLRLSPLNVIILSSTLFVVIGLIVYMAIVFTPLKNLVVGYSEVTTSRQIAENKRVTDSMLTTLQAYDMYFNNLQKRLRGETDSIIPIDSLKKTDYSKIVVDEAGETDLAMREQIEREDLFNLSISDPRETTGAQNLESLHFFPPIKGTVTSNFQPSNKHFGIDVVAPENTPVKACLDGVVIDSYWNFESGNVVVIQHDHGLISFYKHNSQILKRSGNKVRAGDVIAIIGNTGELSSGPHLHFELWHDKTPLDPKEFINFN